MTYFDPIFVFLHTFFYENLQDSNKNRNFANEQYPGKSNQYKRSMKFSLSNDSRTLIQQSTGLDYAHQRCTAISNVDSKRHGNSAYKIKDSRDVAPRGSIYLQMGRIMSLHKVKSYLKRI